MKTDNKLSALKNQKAQISGFKVGDVLTVKIHALNLMCDGSRLVPSTMLERKKAKNSGSEKKGITAQQVGVSLLSNGYTILVPIISNNISLNDEVRISLETVSSGKPKYATAKVVEIVKKANVTTTELPVQVGKIMNVTIAKAGPKNTGLAQVSDNYTIVVPNSEVGQQLQIQISRVKSEYAFGSILTSVQKQKQSGHSVLASTAFQQDDSKQKENSKYHLVLPKTAKLYRGYVVVRLNGSVVFIKLGLGAKLGDTVRIQTMKVGPNYAVAKILKVSPLNKAQKLYLTKTQVQQMIQKGMHFGEKAIRCHANMRSYLWYRKKGGKDSKLYTVSQKQLGSENKATPLMKKDRYYINVLKTRRCLQKALMQLAKYSAKGKTFLFVGTKKSASALIARIALFTKTSFFVNTRWLGGMLTNWKTIRRSMARIRPILKEKQKVIQSILEKRQKIKYRFIQKVNLLRKRGQKYMLKGKNLIAKLKQNKNLLIERSQNLLKKKQEILHKNQVFIQKYIDLKMKKTEYLQKYQIILQTGNMLVYQKNNLLKQLQNNRARLKEFKQLFLIGQELLKLKNNASQNGQQILSVSYDKLQELSGPVFAKQNFTVPNPPKEVLNRIVQSMKMKYETSIVPDNSLNKNQNRAKTADNIVTDAHSSALQTLILSKLLNKFTSFVPFMKAYIENLLLRHQNLVMLLENTQKSIRLFQEQLNTTLQCYEKLSNQLLRVKTKLLSQQKTLKILRAKLRRLAAEQRLLKFLPKLRYLPTPKAQMAQTIQTLMKKFVDPKMTVPMEQIYDDRFKFTSKKIAAARKQQWQRLEKYFGGITKMAKMKKKQISNNVAIIVGQQEEMNAVRECQKLGIKMVTLVDTNCNPKLSDHVIPVNDDSRNSVKFVLQEMLVHIRLAQKLRQKVYLHKTKKYSNSYLN